MRRAPWLLALALTTACGSTVATQPDTASGAAGGGLVSDPSLGGPPVDGGGTGLGPGTGSGGPGAFAPGGTTAAGSGGSGGVTSSTGGGAGVGTAQGPAAGGAPATTGATGPGVTATTINIGLSYSVNSQAAASALGASGAGAGGGDGKRIWDIAVKDINDGGGVLGRKLVPVYHEFDATSGEPQASQEQAACEDWTRDHKVFWVSYAGGDTITPCLHKAGVAHSNSALTDASTAFYRKFPYYVEAGTLQIDRVAAALPERLRAQGYFGAWDTVRGVAGGASAVKVGIVSFDDPASTFAVDRLLVPAVKRLVAGEPEVFKVAYPRSTADNATAISAIQSATLRFRDRGVTHVLPFETAGAGVGTFFAQGAEQQKYYPRYGLTSGNGTQLLVDQGLWPKTQLNGALGIGWLPLVDVRNADNPDDGPDSNDARRSCVAVMTKNGVDASSAIVKRQVVEACNTVRLLKAALEAGGTGVSRDAFLAGVHRLGRSFVSGTTFATFYDPAHHDGVSQVRPVGYTAACECIRYTGPRVPIP